MSRPRVLPLARPGGRVGSFAKAKLLRRKLLAWVAWVLAGCAQELPDSDAAVYLGDAGRSHFSPLTRIHPGNVATLEPAWVHDTNEFGDGVSTMVTSPLVVNGTLYGLTPRLNAFALDAASGTVRWRFETPASAGMQRGLSWWEGGAGTRLFFGAGPWLFALDPRTGTPVSTFADTGRLDLRAFASGADVTAPSPAAVFENLVVVGLDGDIGGASVLAVDARTGTPAWHFRAGVSAGVGMALDADRGLLLVPTGPPVPAHLGKGRPDDLLSDSLLALDIRTGELRWRRQLVREGLRGHELTAPPVLVQVSRQDALADAVALPTRSGYLHLFDRDTGASLLESREVSAPPSTIPGERAAPAHITSTVTLTRQAFALAEREAATGAPESDIAALVREPLAPPSIAGTLLFPGVGAGVGWGGAAYDPASRKLLVNVQETASVLRLIEVPQGFSAQDAYLAHCARCHGVDRKGLFMDRQDRYGAGGPSLVGIGARFTEREIEATIVRGRGAMQPMPEVGELDRAGIVEYLVAEPDYLTYDGRTTESAHVAVEPVTLRGADRLPANAPPWGSLLALDLDTGHVGWRVPLGGYPGHPEPEVGAENAGGPLLTASGLVFIGATPDSRFRAYDAADGTLLWEAELDAAGYATPVTYAVGGRQYVVIAAGGGLLGPPSGSTYAAFRLPD